MNWQSLTRADLRRSLIEAIRFGRIPASFKEVLIGDAMAVVVTPAWTALATAPFTKARGFGAVT